MLADLGQLASQTQLMHAQLQIVTRGQHRVNGRGKFVSRRAVTGTRNSAIQGDGNSGPEPAYSRLSVVDRFCGAPVARITVIR
jgi:hypothetical protein